MTTFSAAAAAKIDELLAAARKIGMREDLVLRGGGNCSVKVRLDQGGQNREVLLVKGSGHDMGSLTEEGLAPLDLDTVRATLVSQGTCQENLLDLLESAKLDPKAPAPSVESLVHAAITAPFVLHSHADAAQAVTDTPDPAKATSEVWGEDALFIPYACPGLPLGEAVRAVLEGKDENAFKALIVGAHGVFTFGESAEEALEKHMWAVEQAENAISEGSLESEGETDGTWSPTKALRLASWRKQACEVAGRALIATRIPTSPLGKLGPDAEEVEVLQRGPATPDHVTWVGPWVVNTLAPGDYVSRYEDYVDHHAKRTNRDVEPKNTYPRSLLDEDLGLVTLGREREEALATAEILDHTAKIAKAAEARGGYVPASEDHVFDLEYWGPQGAKYDRRANENPFAGRIALVTGAASGIGRACAEALLDRGASVIGWDINPLVEETFETTRWLGQVVDVTDFDRQETALAEAVGHFGGLDMLVLSAGIFPAAQHISELDLNTWDRTLAINTTSTIATLKVAHPYLAAAYDGGYVCAIVSKNVLAPGYGAVAYSASKAAMNQACRVAALEWAGDGIRVNMIHPDAVFDTALWTQELLERRAEHYGMSVDDYKKRNLLRAEVTSRKVGDLAASLCSPLFSCTTGAQIPIDGGSDRII